MVISYTLRLAQSRIVIRSLVDTGASGYAFIDKSFARNHGLVFYALRYPCIVRGFDGQPSSTGRITHLAEAILVIQGHVERMFFYITSLQQYPVVLGLPWLYRHSVTANFKENSLTFASPFYLKNCTPSPVKVIAEDKPFLMPKENYEVIKSQEFSQSLASSVFAPSYDLSG